MSNETDPNESDRPATGVNPLDINRRRLLKTSVVTASLAAAGGVTGNVTAREDDWDDLTLRKQLNVVRKATQPYKMMRNLDEAGYVSIPLPIVCSEGLHFDNLENWETPLEPEHPESLFYVVTDGGTLKLGGAEFILLTDVDGSGDPVDPKPDLFNDEDEPVEKPPLRGTTEEDGWHLFHDTATGVTFWDLHVWVHERNPEGVFNLPNPRYADMPGCVPLEELPYDVH